MPNFTKTSERSTPTLPNQPSRKVTFLNKFIRILQFPFITMQHGEWPPSHLPTARHLFLLELMSRRSRHRCSGRMHLELWHTWVTSRGCPSLSTVGISSFNRSLDHIYASLCTPISDLHPFGQVTFFQPYPYLSRAPVHRVHWHPPLSTSTLFLFKLASIRLQNTSRLILAWKKSNQLTYCTCKPWQQTLPCACPFPH